MIASSIPRFGKLPVCHVASTSAGQTSQGVTLHTHKDTVNLQRAALWENTRPLLCGENLKVP